MPTLAPELKSKLERDPAAIVELIVRSKDEPDTHVLDVKARGFIVRHTYSLISALALKGTASAALVLADEAWVLSVEEDKSVHSMSDRS